jgi:hypothetical protein
MRFSAWAWVGGLPTYATRHQPLEARRARPSRSMRHAQWQPPTPGEQQRARRQTRGRPRHAPIPGGLPISLPACTSSGEVMGRFRARGRGSGPVRGMPSWRRSHGARRSSRGPQTARHAGYPRASCQESEAGGLVVPDVKPDTD